MRKSLAERQAEMKSRVTAPQRQKPSREELDAAPVSQSDSQRDVKGRFRPGFAPERRPKVKVDAAFNRVSDTLQDLMSRGLAGEICHELLGIVRDRKIRASQRLAAIETLLAYAEGKPAATLNVRQELLSDQQALRIMELAARLEGLSEDNGAGLPIESVN